MKNPSHIEQLDRLKAEYDSLQPINKAYEEKLWKKFRLEWNYNSNHLEGNTLTYGQTELLLIFDKTTGDHDMREYEEMKAHDVAIKLVQELAVDKERPLTEAFIRQLNKTILVSPFWKEASTPDGQPTRREIIPGEYKQFPNSVRLSNGEMFHYPSPSETPALMSDMMKYYNSHLTDSVKHPFFLAAMLHYKFVSIHPFDDGNGRVARLLMNYVFMKHGYPPVIIKSDKKNEYFNALHKADVGDEESFIQYIAERLIWALEISIKAAKGESIDEPGDLDKKISVLSSRLEKNKGAKIKKSRSIIQYLYQKSLKNFIEQLESKLTKFDSFFNESSKSYSINQAIRSSIYSGNDGKTIDFLTNQIFFDYSDPQKFGTINGVIYSADVPQKHLEYPDLNLIRITYVWNGFNKGGTKAFNFAFSIDIGFEDYAYYISNSFKNDERDEKLYDELMSNDEDAVYAENIATRAFEELEKTINRFLKK